LGRRRAIAAGVALFAVGAVAWIALAVRTADTAVAAAATRSTPIAANRRALESARPDAVRSRRTHPTASAAARRRATLRSARSLAANGRPSDKARLELVEVITGDISPKSVAASHAGYVTAQNMMYRHTVTVYDAKSLKLVKTIPDTVNLGRLGYPEYGTARGAPVEAAFSSNGRYAYVSNYSMYGTGFGPEGSDSCTPSSGTDRSFVYRIDLDRLAIDRAYRVGAVPKVVAVTPDDRFVLVSNWCTWDLSVVSTRLGREVKRIPIGPYPRGIAVAPDGSTAYVAVMGGNELVRVDLRRWTTSRIGVGAGPRAVKIEPTGRYAFVSLNAEGRVAKLDLQTGVVQAKVTTGSAPRSLELAGDGRSLYVVNYESGTVTKLRTSDMRPLETVRDGQCLLPPDRDHLRPRHQAGVGRLLHGIDSCLQRLVGQCPFSRDSLAWPSFSRSPPARARRPPPSRAGSARCV
jgi:DNA-binding beta-propeller fold protein YncE